MTSINSLIILCFFPRNPHLKTDGISFSMMKLLAVEAYEYFSRLQFERNYITLLTLMLHGNCISVKLLRSLSKKMRRNFFNTKF